MKFFKFPKMTNHYKSKDIQKILDFYPEFRNELFAIQEKRDGANFQVSISPEGVRYGKRSSLLAENANFYGYQAALQEDEVLQEAFAKIRETFFTNLPEGVEKP